MKRFVECRKRAASFVTSAEKKSRFKESVAVLQASHKEKENEQPVVTPRSSRRVTSVKRRIGMVGKRQVSGSRKMRMPFERRVSQKSVGNKSFTQSGLERQNTGRSFPSLDASNMDGQMVECMNAIETAQNLEIDVNDVDTVSKKCGDCSLFPGFVKASDVAEIQRVFETSEGGDDNEANISQTLFFPHQLELKYWSLPDKIVKRYSDLGVTHMFNWQADCLLTSNALQGGNLVYSAPTSAGKTLVAELLILKQVVETRRKALFILPFVSVAQEKTRYLRALFQDVGLRVDAFVGPQSPACGLAAVDVAVCTIEKANSLLNRLLEEREIQQLGIIVVDELHMAGDSSRGYLLELLLTKVQFVTSGAQRSDCVQIVGMSATLPNLQIVADWLHAELYCTSYRPVPLTEYIKIGNHIYNKTMELIRSIPESKTLRDDFDHVIWLCQETVSEGHSVLIFCPTKNQCEKLAERVAANLTQGSRGCNICIDSNEVKLISERLERTQTGIDRLLAKTLPSGVAFHHAGLTGDEREIIEIGFRRSVIRVLTATSTLSSGVNLPARRVIIRSPVFHRTTLDPMTYKQMVGRAGRKGVDSCGESILVCKPVEKQRGISLIQSSLKPVRSCLMSGESTDGHCSAMKRALLEVIAGGVAVTCKDVERYIECTLLAAEMKAANSNTNAVKETVVSALEFLHENEFISLRRDDDDDEVQCEGNSSAIFHPTQLGAACLASALSPDEALVVLSELQRARKSFVLENELHLVYQVTPVFLQKQWPCPNWYNFLCLWGKLTSDMLRVANLVGVKESFLVQAVNGRVPERTSEQRSVSRIHRRFFTALALHDLIQETPLHVVAARYSVSRGLLQSLQGTAATFAGMVTVFCQRLSWHNMELLLSQFQRRLCFGIERELCDLVTISLLNGQRARALYNAGFRSLSSIAVASPLEIEFVLQKLAPFRSTRDEDMNRSNVNWISKLRMGITESEAAEDIVKEAQFLVKEKGNGQATCGVTECQKQSIFMLKMKDTNMQTDQVTHVDIQENTTATRNATCQQTRSNVSQSDCHNKSELAEIQQIKSTFAVDEEVSCRHHEEEQKTENEVGRDRSKSNVMEESCLLFSGDSLMSVCQNKKSPMLCCAASDLNGETQAGIDHMAEKHATQLQSSICKHEAIAETPEFAQQLCNLHERAGVTTNLTVDIEVNPQSVHVNNTSVLKQLESPIALSFDSKHLTRSQLPLAISTPIMEGFEYRESSSSMNDLLSCPHTRSLAQSIQRQFASPACIVSAGDFAGFTPDHCGASSGSYMLADFSSETMQQLEAACCDAENDKLSNSNRLKNEANNYLVKRLSFTDCELKMMPKIEAKELQRNTEEIDEVAVCAKSQTLMKQNALCSTAVHCMLQKNQTLQTGNAIQSDTKVERFTLCNRTDKQDSAAETLQSHFSVSHTRQIQGHLHIIDVVDDKNLFQLFLEEWKSQSCYALCLACHHVSDTAFCQNRFRRQSARHLRLEGIAIPNSTERIIGIAVCWKPKEVYFLSLALSPAQSTNVAEDDLESHLCGPSVHSSITQTMRLNALRDMIEGCDALSVCVMFDVKEQIKKLFTTCNVSFVQGLFMDPKVADWLLGPDKNEKNLYRLLLNYLPDEVNAKKEGIGFLAMNPGSPRVKACAEAVLTLMLMNHLKPMLEAESLWKAFTQIEMPSMITLAKMENNGIGFSQEECEKQKGVLQKRRLALEQEAYRLAGRKFCLSNPKDLSTVMFHELGISPPTEICMKAGKPREMKRGRRLIQFSTSKDALERLQMHHKLPAVILEWRRIHCAITRTLYPIQKDRQFNVMMGTDRIHFVCQTHTATGRVSVCNPNLQNVPREFDIGSAVTMTSPYPTLVVSRQGKIQRSQSPLKTITTTSICMRNFFTASSGALLLAVDYSQLELRLIAHLSQDRKLKDILSSGGDVFKMIASEWLSVDIDQVSAMQRQQAKQICYGMIYGIGAKALAEQLKVCESDALQFMDSFKSQYTGLKSYLTETVMNCRQCGYVETLMGRKRYLPAIHSTQPHARSQAERQAVNTTIQGSAADLVKLAMTNVDRKLLEKYPHAHDGKRHGGMLVLQIHDELLYDVVEEDLLSVAMIVRQELEHAVNLSVPLPVKLRVGLAWGSLETLKLDDM